MQARRALTTVMERSREQGKKQNHNPGLEVKLPGAKQGFGYVLMRRSARRTLHEKRNWPNL